MAAYDVAVVERLAAHAGLRLARDSLPGSRPGASGTWLSPQDLVLLERTTR